MVKTVNFMLCGRIRRKPVRTDTLVKGRDQNREAGMEIGTLQMPRFLGLTLETFNLQTFNI
jgi:hypothetical protein